MNGQDDKVGVQVNVTCTTPQAKLLDPAPAVLAITSLIGQSVAAKFGFVNKNDATADLTYQLTSDPPVVGSKSILMVSPASGKLTPGQSVEAQVVARCVEAGTEVRSVSLTSNGGSGRVSVAVTCVSVTITAVTPYNGPAQGYARVAATAQASSPFAEVGSSLHFGYLIDEVPAQPFTTDESGASQPAASGWRTTAGPRCFSTPSATPTAQPQPTTRGAGTSDPSMPR